MPRTETEPEAEPKHDPAPKHEPEAPAKKKPGRKPKAATAEESSTVPAPESPAEAVASGNYPPGCPDEDLRYGDKTPAIAEWLLENHPEDFKRRYAGRKVLGRVQPK